MTMLNRRLNESSCLRLLNEIYDENIPSNKMLLALKASALETCLNILAN